MFHLIFLLSRFFGMKILTQNIYIRPPLISSNNGDFKDQRLNEFKKVLVDYDIVCLQEMFGSFSSRRKNLVEYAFSIGFKYHAVGPDRRIFRGKLIDSGLVILSRFPILETKSIQYSSALNPDKLSAKGALFIKIEIQGNPLYVFNTHLQASYNLHLHEDSPVVLTRKIQLQQFKLFIKNNIQAKDKVVVCGDFNVNSLLHDFEYQTLNKSVPMADAVLQFFKHHPVTFYPWEYRFKGNVATEEKESLDYIFYQNVIPKTIAVVKTEYPFKWRHISDHFGVSMEF
eukprot:NODE_288_length_10680_cov_0.431245.p5 type:complete len:285 gc:universal NODE_288_length_10680_cov_0.431245:1540-686(-)